MALHLKRGRILFARSKVAQLEKKTSHCRRPSSPLPYLNNRKCVVTVVVAIIVAVSRLSLGDRIGMPKVQHHTAITVVAGQRETLASAEHP